MSNKIIDGKLISTDIKNETKQEVEIIKRSKKTPSLAVVLVGNDPASKVYVNSKNKVCEYVGIKSSNYELPADARKEDIIALIHQLNEDKDINGILIQLPLPSHFDEDEILLHLNPKKDVDCTHPFNIGCLHMNKNTFKPCTPEGIIELIKRSNIEISGKHCVILGRSNVVGKPVSSLFLAENGFVTICHSKTVNIGEICKNADILVTAIGKPKFVTGYMVKEEVTIIDVGINKLEDGTICGDVDFNSCLSKARYITPVPGGVGPMTTAILMRNVVKACYMQQ